MDTTLRSISILIPTLNSGHVLDLCLKSIAEQDYPHNLVEIIIADGGSTDNTCEIARRYTDKIYPNPLKTGEAGKAVALKHAKGDIVAFIDSDNILPSTDWLTRMVAPFADAEIVGAEPLKYTYRKEDGYITRYCAMMGMNDPLCLFLGNYDRYNILTRRWTEMPVVVEDRGSYLRVHLDAKRLPTIGANGFLVRRSALAECSIQSFFFDIDVIYELSQQGKNRFAKVKIGIVHTFSGNVNTFVKKQERRVKDYPYYSKNDLRKYPWRDVNKKRLAKFIVYSISTIPLLIQSFVGICRQPDQAWFFHPVACWITVIVYGRNLGASILGVTNPSTRRNWRP